MGTKDEIVESINKGVDGITTAANRALTKDEVTKIMRLLRSNFLCRIGNKTSVQYWKDVDKFNLN